MSNHGVAFYMHNFSGGGVERMRLALIAELRSRGMEVTLIVGRRDGELVNLAPRDLAVIELGGHGMVSAIPALVRAIRRVRPRVLVSSLDHNNITAVLAVQAACTGTRVVICQHNALSAERAAGWKYRVIPWLYWMLQHWIHGIVAVSNGVAADLARIAGISRNRITTIYNPVIGTDFHTLADQAAPHPWLIGEGPPTFLFAGRLTAQKHPALLLQAFALLLRQREANLIVLGAGPLLADLRTEVARLGMQGRVAFAGFQANPLPWIAHATCLVSSSRYEGLGNVLIEALACGVPVIATDCPHGPSEILLGGTIGELVPVDDAACLAGAMGRVLDATPDRAALRHRAASFTAAACADAHLALFAKLGSQPTRAFGLTMSGLRAGDIIDHMMQAPALTDVRLVVTPNIDHIRLLRKTGFAAAYASACVVCPDGFPVLLYARLRGLALTARVTGCALFEQLANHADLNAKRVFVVVESHATAIAVRNWADRRRLPTVQVHVARQGLATDMAAQTALAAAIHATAADILVMTLGAPLSETFVHRHRRMLPPCWALCVGQAVRVHLGLVQRAPAGWRRLGAEWVWRIAQEPRRLSGRYLRALAWFPVAVLLDLIGRKQVRSAP